MSGVISDNLYRASGVIASAGGGGKIGQVITGTDSTQRDVTSSSTFVTGSNTLSVSITPTATSSKIFVICSTTWALSSTSNTMFGTIFRDSTDLGAGSDKGLVSSQSTSDASAHWHGVAVSILDSPSSTSAITYQFYVRSTNASYICRINYDANKGSLTAWEVLA